MITNIIEEVNQMKGITPIISIIVLLLITVSLAGAAYVFLSVQMESYTGKAIQASGVCVGGTQAFITVSNLGTQSVSLTGCDSANPISGQSENCNDITVVRTDGGSMSNAYFDVTSIPAAVPGQISKATFTDDGCGASGAEICRYAFTRAGEIQPVEISISCSG
jgi:flagellin-like protein